MDNSLLVSNSMLFVPADESELADAQEYGFLVCPKYFYWNLSGAKNHILLRPHVLLGLKKAEEKLPKSFRFLLLDGYRTFETQQFLYDDLFSRWRKIFHELSDNQIYSKMKGFVAVPNRDKKSPSPHITGCAIDLTLFDTTTNQPLEMGTDFDDFTERAYSDFFLHHPPENMVEEIAQKNRDILRNSLLLIGFLPNKKEWWHFELHREVKSEQ